MHIYSIAKLLRLSINLNYNHLGDKGMTLVKCFQHYPLNKMKQKKWLDLNVDLFLIKLNFGLK